MAVLMGDIKKKVCFYSMLAETIKWVPWRISLSRPSITAFQTRSSIVENSFRFCMNM